MKSFVLGIHFTLFFIVSFSQKKDYNMQLYSINSKYDLAFAFRVDSDFFHYYHYIPRDNKKKIFLNNRALDSTGIQFNVYPKPEVITKDNSIYNLFTNTQSGTTGWINNFSTSIYEINLEQKRISKKNTFVNTFIDPLRDFYSARIYGNDSIVYKIDPSKAQLEILIDNLPSFPSLNIYSFFDLEEVTYINRNKILLEYADCEGGCADYRCLIYDLSNKTYSEARFVNDLSNEQKEADKNKVSGFNLEIVMSDLTDTYLYGYFEDVKTKDLKDDYIFNDKLNIVSPALKRVSYGDNYNYNNGKVTSVMLRTKLDDKKEVFVPYKFTLSLERTYFRVFNNDQILPEDLKTFAEYELSLVKNLIFAKHNYKFDSEFYQAYFNLFAFFNAEGKRENRTREVNGALTESDKKNLNTITKALRKYEK